MFGLILGGLLGTAAVTTGMVLLMKSKAPTATKVAGGIGLGLLGVTALAALALGGLLAILTSGPAAGAWIADAASPGPTYAATEAAPGSERSAHAAFGTNATTNATTNAVAGAWASTVHDPNADGVLDDDLAPLSGGRPLIASNARPSDTSWSSDAESGSDDAGGGLISGLR